MKTNQTEEKAVFPSVDSLVDAGCSSQDINRMIDAEAELDIIERDEPNFTASEFRARIQKQAFPSLLQSSEDERRNELNWEQAIHDANMERDDYNLRDEGRNPDGSGESYAERNV